MSLTAFSVFDMLMLIILYISLNVADVSLSESGHLVPYGLTPHSIAAWSLRNDEAVYTCVYPMPNFSI